MGLASAILTHYVAKPTVIAKKTAETAIMDHNAFKVIQSHRFWYQWKEHMRFPISE